MKNILITGGAGFIGSNLALQLLQKGHNVTVLDSLAEQIHGAQPELGSSLYLSIKDKVHFIKGDVTDESVLKNAIEGQQVVVHLAAETGTGQSMYEIKKYVDVNIGGTALLLDILVNEKTEVEKVVVASSRSIYGEGRYHSEEYGFVYPDHREVADMDAGFFEVKYKGDKALSLVATDEDSKVHPSSVYGITKQNQEQMVLSVCNAIGISGVAFRYQNVYGPGQSLKNPYTGILSIFSTRIKNGNSINIFEDGKESRDFVFIDDVVSATIAGIENEAASGQVYNVGSGVATDVLTVAKTLIKNYQKDTDLTISGNYRIGDIRHNYADLSKIESQLNFSPQFHFEEGIGHFCNWVNSQEVNADGYTDSIEQMKKKGLYR